MSATRTDIHRPSAPTFDPEAYDCQGVFDLNPEWGDNGDRIRTVNRMIQEGYRFASHQAGGQCGHCGARLRYVALLTYDPSMEMIWVGETCLSGRFESLTKAQFDQLRKTAKLDRERQARIAAFQELCQDCPALVWATYAHNIGVAGLGDHRADLPALEQTWGQRNDKSWAIGVLDDIANSANRYGNLTVKQAELIERLVGELETAEEATGARSAAKALEEANAKPVPTGRFVIEGEVLTVKPQVNDFDPFGGSVLKMLVAGDGWKVWGTVPAAIDGVDRGDRVRFTATVKPKEGDETFGYYSRPSKAEVLVK
jgi:hypothetical protein